MEKFYITIINETEAVYSGDNLGVAMDIYNSYNINSSIKSVEVQSFDQDEACEIVADSMDIIAQKGE